MDLSTLTPGQRESVRRVDGPLLVSAGAGSGKTFTLTQRIAYALSEESGPFLRDIDEVCAITFTEKAAGEIKARVKRTLRSEGRLDQALKVDAAWISTIHGACSRILRAHALELGIDPAFGIVGDAERGRMLTASMNEALASGNEILGRPYAALLAEYAAAGGRGSSAAGMVDSLLSMASTLRGGLNAVSLGQGWPAPTAVAKRLLAAYEELLPVLEQAGSSASAQRAQAAAADAVEKLEVYLLADGNAAVESARGVGRRGGRGAGRGAAGGADGAARELAHVLDGCAWVGANFGSAEVKAHIKKFQCVHGRMLADAALLLARPRADELLALAREVQRRYEARKQAAGKLDNDDLLTRTLAAFEGHPAIAESFADRFKLVMVDEFQDTSQLQIDLISYLAGEHCCRLCTVGDAQQSIYRFRGADVGVYEQHKRDMRSPDVGATYVELSKNFRSHADVLSFVDRIFEQPHVFGERFMSLEPNEARPSRWFGGPRIDVVLATQPAGRGTGVTSDDVRRAAAQAVAVRFAALREAGHAAGDMVVLLGRMTHAQEYADALRAEGFECVVAGGSLFADAPEVRLVGRIAQAVANPADSGALFEVLTSDVLRLSADDFLDLATGRNEQDGSLRRRELAAGFSRLREAEGLEPRLAHAVSLLERAQQTARSRSLSRGVRQVLVESGWLARLEGQGASGLAQAGNVLKALRLVERVEGETRGGAASVARAVADELASGLKEAPGALSAKAGNSVRIMTIHASKGLEFPIVAVADFNSSSRASSKLLLEACGRTAFSSLLPDRSLSEYPSLKKRAAELMRGCYGWDEGELEAAARVLAADDGEEPNAACGPASLRAALAERTATEELAEGRRKLYVALTRASEALVVAATGKEAAEGKPFSYSSLTDDIRQALCGGDDFPGGKAELPYGGSAPARFERIMVASSERCDAAAAASAGEVEREDEGAVPGEGVASAVSGEDAATGATCEALCSSAAQPAAEEPPAAAPLFCVPPLPAALPACEPWRPLREGVFSYSSISHSDEDDSGAAAKPVSGARPASPASGQVAEVAKPAGEAPNASLWDDAGQPLPAPPDAEKATALGSAFHRAAQFAVETGQVPGDGRVDALARTYGISPAQRVRLDAALARWFGSEAFAQACAFPCRAAETPFLVRIEEALMEGEIDLLCTQAPPGSEQASGTHAVVFDYKTGGSDDEAEQDLHEKHLLQAQCYAYAVLGQGFGSVELRFVRVERPARTGDAAQPDEVRYTFTSADVPELQRIIATAYRKVR